MSAHILVVEDDTKTRMTLAYRLEYAGYQVTQVADGRSALAMLEEDTFDVVLTDILLGDIDGVEVLHTARLQAYRPAVILLTGHGSLDTSIAAVREGAYDYLLKPCAPDHLLTTIEGALKQYRAEQQMREAASNLLGALKGSGSTMPDTPPGNLPAAVLAEPHAPAASEQSSTPIRIGALTLGSTRHEVSFDDQLVHVTPMEYALLYYLAQHAGQICRCYHIVQYTHGIETNDSDAQSLLRSHIRNLRKKIDPAYLVNDRGMGYMLIDPATTGG